MRMEAASMGEDWRGEEEGGMGRIARRCEGGLRFAFKGNAEDGGKLNWDGNRDPLIWERYFPSRSLDEELRKYC